MPRTNTRILIAAALAAIPVTAFAVTDNTVLVVSTTDAVGTFSSPATLQGFAYDPVNDRMIVAGSPTANQQIRLIENVSTTPTSKRLVGTTAWQWFTKNGDPSAGVVTGGTPTPGGLLFNPKSLSDGTPAWGNVWLTDASSTLVRDGVSYPNNTQRISRFNLQEDAGPSDTLPGNARNELSTVLSLGTFQANGGPSGSSNMNRNFAWSGDGQLLYFVDTNSGIFKISPLGGAPTKMLAESTDLNTEPAVLTNGTIDTIYFRGGGSTGNVGGIDKINHDRSNGSFSPSRTIFKTKAEINDFMELTSAQAIANSVMTSDADGNLYFTDSTGPRSGLFMIDPYGRMVKIASRIERAASLGTGTSNTNMLRLTPRTVVYGSGAGTFNVTQLLYAENTSSMNFIAGVYVFKPGDFDRNNNVNQADIAAFKSKLTPRGQQIGSGSAELYRYDLNGSNSVDWKDVKVLQQFYAFRDGDANIDQTVDSVDFNALLANYGVLTNGLWTQGDFDGDQKITTTDFNILAENFGIAPPVLPGATLGALVPEPASLSGLLAGVFVMLRPKRSDRV